MGSGTYGSQSQPTPQAQPGRSGKGMPMQPQPTPQAQPGRSGKGALLANTPQAPEQLAMMQARQAGMQVGPTPNQPPNPYAGMSTAELQQMNAQMNSYQQQMQQQMQMQQQLAPQDPMQQATQYYGTPQIPQMQARQAGMQVGPTPNQPPNPYAGMSTAELQEMNAQMQQRAQMQQQMQIQPGQQLAPQNPMQQPDRASMQAQLQQMQRVPQAPMQPAPRSAKGGQRRPPMMNSGLGALLASRMSR